MRGWRRFSEDLPSTRVELAARRSAAAYSIGVALTCIPTLVDVAEPGPDAALPIGVFAAFAAVLGVVSWRRVPPPWLALATLAAGCWFYVVARQQGSLFDLAITGLLVAYPAVTIAVLVRKHRWFVSAAVAAPVIWVELTEGLSLATLETIGPALATTAACWGFLTVAQRTERQMDRVRRDQVRAAGVSAAQEARLAAHRTAQAILHDDVLAALRAVATPEVSRQEAVEAVQRAWRSLTRRGESSPGTDLLLALRSIRVPGLRARVISRAGSLDLEPAVVAAITDSAAEALRNTLRHSGVRQAAIRVVRTTGGIDVQVTDRGRGFDPQSQPASHGLRSSVTERMERVGGAAAVDSAPGRGTTVRLTWQPASPSDASLSEELATRDGSLLATVGDPRAVVAAATVPFVSYALLWCVVGQALGQPSWLVAWALIYAAVGGFLLLRGSADSHPIGLIALSVLAVGGVAVFVSTTPPEVLSTGLAWPIALAATSSAVIAPMHSHRWAIALAGTLLLLVGAAAIGGDPADPAAALTGIGPTLMSCVWPALGGMTVRAALVAVVDREEAIVAEIRDDLARGLVASRRRQSLDERLDHFRSLVEPLLRPIAEGIVDPSDPAVRAEALVVEEVARGELQFPWLMRPGVVELVRQATEDGVELSLTSTANLVETPDAASDLLRAALAQSVDLAGVTLTVLSERTMVSLVATLRPGTDGTRVRRRLLATGAQVREVEGVVIAQAMPASEARREEDADLTDLSAFSSTAADGPEWARW